MKFLKTYRIFESVDEHIEVLKDMALELKDNDFRVEIYKGNVQIQTGTITNLFGTRFHDKKMIKGIYFTIYPSVPTHRPQNNDNHCVSDLVIDATLMVIDYMYQNSYKLVGSKDLKEDKIRIQTKTWGDVYLVDKEDLNRLKNNRFNYIELIFTQI